ncbi:MAG: killer suppression protein [Lentisphaeria bacterium]|jgi:proteic killer suppression protein|nr:killer suppression protein [Lentisphaeria bacterium]
MAKQYGAKMAGKLKQRLMELRAANVLSDISHLPPPRLHELTNRNGVFSVNLDERQRLLFVPANEPVPRLDEGGIDTSKVTEIEITDIEDTHDPKNQRRGGK